MQQVSEEKINEPGNYICFYPPGSTFSFLKATQTFVAAIRKRESNKPLSIEVDQLDASYID